MSDFEQVNNMFGQIFGENPFKSFKPSKRELIDMYLKGTITKKELDERMEKYYGRNNN